MFTSSVIGCGSGGRLSLSAYDASPHFTLTAACDTSDRAREEVQEKYPGVRVFATHAEMLAECPTDVVSVSTYPPTHLPITLEALNTPVKGLLVEKPLGDTARAGREIVHAVKARSIPVVVPHSWWARDVSYEIDRRIRENSIGRLHQMEVLCRNWDIFSAGIHWVHFFLSVAPESPVRFVMAAADTTSRTYRDGMQVETAAVTYVELQAGTRLVMQTGDDTRLDRGETVFRFYGQAGSIEWVLGEPSFSIRNHEHPAGGTESPAAIDPRAPHQRYLDDLARQIETGNHDYRIPELSLTALEVCEAACISATRRCRVAFPYERFVPPEDTGWEIGKPYSGTGGGRDGRERLPVG